MTTARIELRNLASLEACRAVVAVQEAVWGRDSETVPASVLMVSAKRGGILIGAYVAAGDLAGFVWSMPGTRDGTPVHWSHMLGVLPAYRHLGVARRLKVAQRDRAIAAGSELIEWTFDPLQAANAHFNLHVLGASGASYAVDVYGALSGPLHQGTPTDRLMVEWRIRDRLERRAELMTAPVTIRAAVEGDWVRCTGVDIPPNAPRLLVPVPPRFLEMQQDATDRALEWRLAVRQVMTMLFERGYRAIDFRLDRERGGGAYLFAAAKP